MSEPTPTDVHVNQLLTNVSIGYINTMYIADMLFPLVNVRKQSDIIPRYDQSHWFRNTATLRGPGSVSLGGGFKVDNTLTYFCQRYSYRFEIPDETRDNSDEPYNMDSDGTMFVTDKMQMAREIRFATDFFTTGIWTGDQTGVAAAPAANQFIQWNDYAASTPLTDVETWADNVEGRIARMPTDMVIGKQAWSKLKWHPDLIDTIKYTQRGQLTTDIVAALFEMQRLHVGRAIQTTSVEGTAEASVAYTRVFGKAALLLYVPPAPSLMTPAAGYTFVWQRVPNAIQYIKTMRNEEREIDIIEGNSYFDQARTAAGAGLFATALVA